MVNVLVTGVGSLIGQGIIRTIRQSSLACRIVGADYFEDAVGLYWVDRGYILPDLLKKDVKERQWIQEVTKIIGAENIDIVLVGLDFEVEVFAKYKKEIEEATKARVMVGSPEAVTICKDKWKTVDFLKKNHLPYPESCLPGEVEKFLKMHPFPLVVKPRCGFRSRDLFVVNSGEDLAAALKHCPNPIVQEDLGSPQEEYTCGSLLVEGRVLSVVCLRRLLKDGNTARAFLTEDCSQLNDFIRKVTQLLQLEGPANFQLRKTAKGPVIFEINPRFSGTTPMRALFGRNEIELLIKATLFKQFQNDTPLRTGVVLRYFDEQFVPLEQYEQWGKP